MNYFSVSKSLLHAIEEARKLEGSYSNPSGHQSKVYKLSGEHNEGDPYHVKLFKNGKHYEPADYFTNDKDDAHSTAKAMVKKSAERVDEVQQDNDSMKKATDDFVAKGGEIKQIKPKKEPKTKFYTSSTAHQRGRGSRLSSVMRAEENIDVQMKVHPMGLHVMPVKVQGKTKYKVHAVGKNLGSGIKVGEHLSDTDLDDASEMGAKIKHIREEAVDKTVELHDDFVLNIPSDLKYADYISAAKSYTVDPTEQIMIADQFYIKNDESLVIEAFTRSDIESKIEVHRKAGSKVGLPKYSTNNGKPHAEYTVTDKEGNSTRYIHHGSTRRVERQ